jgi:tetratricopeptide (TPR) repeat protein
MESARRQSLWYLLHSDTREARRARQRLAAGTCLALFFAGLLAAVGLGIVVVAACVLFAGAVAVAAAARALHRHHHRLAAGARNHAAGARSRASDTQRVLARNGTLAWHHARHGADVLGRALGRYGSHGREYAKRVPGLLETSASRAAAGVRQIQVSPPRPIDLQREALRLNAEGTNRRRQGEYAEAVDLHTRALMLLHDVDNPQAVALTQNNLALALSHVGDDGDAISLFEQAAATLHELGDKENEGKVMANLALAHRRHGRDDESTNVLRLALSKLERDSSAYELVEAQLRRAS